MRPSAADIGHIARQARKSLGLTQKDIALTSGTGLRFISDLERGKTTCQLGKTLAVLNTLGVNMTFELPPSMESEGKTEKERG